MKTSQFKNILQEIHSLNTLQFRQLKEHIISIESQEEVAHQVESSRETVHCPHCQDKRVQRWGRRNGLQRYRCKECHKTFNCLTGTPLGRLRKKEYWLDYADCISSGLSVRKSALKCQIHRNTAFRWRHRFLKNANSIKPDNLNGIVEVDETYFLKSEKGNKNLLRKSRKRGGKASQRGVSKELVCVLVCRDRNKSTFDKIFESFNASELEVAINGILSKDALFCSDGKPVYKKYVKENMIRHGCLNLSKGIRVKKDIVHIQNVNAYHSRLKEWLFRFHGVATKYLENYLSWFRELDEFNMQISPKTILLRAKQCEKYKIQPLTVT